TYTWSVPSGAGVTSGQGKDTASITFGSVSGTVSVHTDLCPGDSSAISVIVNLLPVVSLSAAKDTICVNNTKDSLMVSPSGGTLSGTGVSGSNFNANVAGAGSHKVVYSYTDTSGCSNSDTIVINVNVCAGINEVVSLDNAITLYPNPFTNTVNINFGVDGPVTLSLFNMLGENMGTWNVNKGNTTIDTKDIPTGVYNMEIKTKSGILNKKLVKVN
ncbi:MAG TPA: T9SS type A sorting domain-containing protein, partial [Bacteroidia bacterium]|nr:T9SS type A sorting domain-containing protein [Bacteroidia bacterium]